MAEAAKAGMFAIYKPGQGKWLRWGTVGTAAVIIACGAYWLAFQQTDVALLGDLWKALIALVWIALCGWLVFWFVNSPKYGEFLIMTESELRKVSWPSRKEVINSVKVVIILTLLLGGLLCLVDVGFIGLFQWMGIA